MQLCFKFGQQEVQNIWLDIVQRPSSIQLTQFLKVTLKMKTSIGDPFAF